MNNLLFVFIATILKYILKDPCRNVIFWFEYSGNVEILTLYTVPNKISIMGWVHDAHDVTITDRT